MDTMTTATEEYIDRRYTDRMTGDVMLIGPGRWKKTRSLIDGMLFEVDTQLMGTDSMRESFLAAMDGVKYDGPLDKGTIVIDLVRIHHLVELPLPNKVEFTNYLTYYLGELIPFLEKEKVSEEEIERFKSNIGATVDYLVSILEKDELRLYIGMRGFTRYMGGSVVCAHYEGGYDPKKAPNFLYLAYGLKSERFWPPEPCRDESATAAEEEHDESDVATSAESDAASSSSNKRSKKKVGKNGRRG